MNRIQFHPGLSLPAFLRQFGTEAHCAAALEQARWPQGFRCPGCGEARHYLLQGGTHRTFQCQGCRKQTSLIAGTLFALLLAFAHLYLGTNIFLAGLTLNIMAQGGTIFLLYTLTGDKGNSSTLPSLKVPAVIIPGIHNIPLVGEILSGHPVFVYLAFLMTWLVAIFLYRTRLGTHLRAVGENAEAAASVGMNVNRGKAAGRLWTKAVDVAP